MKGHNQNKYLHNYIKSHNPTHAEWTEYRVNLGGKNLVCAPGFAAESLNVPVCQGLCQPGGVGVLGEHSLMGSAASGPGVAIPGLDWVLWIIPHLTQGQILTQDPAESAKSA